MALISRFRFTPGITLKDQTRIEAEVGFNQQYFRIRTSSVADGPGGRTRQTLQLDRASAAELLGQLQQFLALAD